MRFILLLFCACSCLGLSTIIPEHSRSFDTFQETPRAQETSSISLSPDSMTVHQWIAPYRRWFYYTDFVVSTATEKQLGFSMVDGPTVFRGDSLWQMLYFGFDGRGYQSCLAVSQDLIHWVGRGRVLGFGARGSFDFGGVTLTAPLYDSYDIVKPPRLKRWKGRYWSLYGSYPEQGGYELGAGSQGLAWSSNGITWQRCSDLSPVLSIVGSAPWENRVVYAPYLLEHNGLFWNFYNAKGLSGREQIGIATSKDLIRWQRFSGNPIIRNREGLSDALLAADPRVYWDRDHWTMFYFGASRDPKDGKVHAHIMVAFSIDLMKWYQHPEPIVKAGGHPGGLDNIHAHNVSIIHDKSNGILYMFYCAVGAKGRGISLLTNKPIS